MKLRLFFDPLNFKLKAKTIGSRLTNKNKTSRNSKY